MTIPSHSSSSVYRCICPPDPSYDSLTRVVFPPFHRIPFLTGGTLTRCQPNPRT
ncbi:hypothetical protein M426DRAFT_204832 [Hypoxylon sp. CI-4A]|nr:hypothetical protein M426DRAFT_204832 [Hypoxylon sp. CI-4A]